MQSPEYPEPNIPNKFLPKIREVEEIQQANIGPAKKQWEIVIQQLISDQPRTAERLLEDGTLNPDFRYDISPEFSSYLKRLLYGKILDIGSGPKEELEGLTLSNDIVYLDKFNPPKTRSIIGDARNLPFTDNIFDCVFSSNVIHGSFREDKIMLDEMLRVVKSGGSVVIIPSGGIEDTLLTIQSCGVDLESQCEMEVFKNYNINERLGLVFNMPQAVISLKVA